MDENNLAYKMALRSRECVHNHDKEGWLGMYAEDGVIEDPIGATPLDPQGKGHSTPEAREKFWDNNIANANINIDIKKSYTAASNECANILLLTIKLEFGGKKYQQIVDGIFTYEINEDGKLQAMRGYWEYEDGIATLKEIE